MEENPIDRVLQEGLVAQRMKVLTRLSDRCFESCIDSFRSKSLSTEEAQCIDRCTDKYIRFIGRVQLRLAEQKYFENILSEAMDTGRSY
eukprot:TRINITY_DN845_c0_g1_i1.p1 TRINITY_DN845_c0_g1~~TRINITY_DN845_c0_g1_i1.p1  ORF type:complete len:104 (-),score=31.41 TRINITY_DN845_c0_g1_i1:253-519(-)